MSLGHAQSFRDLVVHQKARAVSKRIFERTKVFPKEEMYSLTDQVRRSARAIGAQIAEAWGKRRYPKHFVSKLSDADAEQLETQHWLDVSQDCGYLSAEDGDAIRGELCEIGRMLNSMMSKAEAFCGGHANSLREAPADYGVCLDAEAGTTDNCLLMTEH
jgi:four helix bundle protein